MPLRLSQPSDTVAMASSVAMAAANSSLQERLSGASTVLVSVEETHRESRSRKRWNERVLEVQETRHVRAIPTGWFRPRRAVPSLEARTRWTPRAFVGR